MRGVLKLASHKVRFDENNVLWDLFKPFDNKKLTFSLDHMTSLLLKVNGKSLPPPELKCRKIAWTNE